MKKKMAKKLVLSKETLKTIEDTGSRKVEGGIAEAWTEEWTSCYCEDH